MKEEKPKCDIVKQIIEIRDLAARQHLLLKKTKTINVITKQKFTEDLESFGK